jgi:histidine ammonia-lyase
MGANAAVQLHEMLPEIEKVLSYELLTASQALTFRDEADEGAGLSPQQTALLADFRAAVPPEQVDVFMAPKMAAATSFIGKYALPQPPAA